ncbi:MAG: hypothetical protein HY819_11040 [Acidobacteria bacterium]|nr:hypothetical protein [Acidobacteriota bacterium]
MKKYKISFFLCLSFIILLNFSFKGFSTPKTATNSSTINTEQLKQHIFQLINQERRSQGLRPIELDDFASKIAERHAKEMLEYEFTSHWNQAGLKPYMRYSLAGGTDAVGENVAGKWSNSGFDNSRIPSIIEQLHLAMFNETPPNDSHRRTILSPEYTHVGLAFMFNNYRVQIAEEFLARYIEVEPIERKVKLGKDILLKGELLFEGTDIHTITITYEPFPEPLEVAFLNRTGGYSFPQDRLVLRPKLTDGRVYSDDSTGEIDVDQKTGKFSCQINSKGGKAGVYTLVVTLNHEGRKFPATNICIEVK